MTQELDKALINDDNDDNDDNDEKDNLACCCGSILLSYIFYLLI